MERWGPDQALRLLQLVDGALPGEALSQDELLSALWEDPDPAIVVGEADAGVAAGVVRRRGTSLVAFLQLVAVAPVARRRRLATGLVRAVEEWAWEQGASAVVPGGGAPYYLWPGVDVRSTGALCLFEALGYRPTGAALNMSFPSRFRAPAPEGVEVGRVLDDHEAAAVARFCGRHWPGWVPEVERGIEHASCLAAQDSRTGAVVGFACHSVNRAGWLGPMATDPTRRRGGVGAALLGAVAADVMAAGLGDVEVAWVGPVGFYAAAAGASVSRVFRTLELSRPGA